MVLEDDVGLNNYSDNIISHLISQAIKYSSNYIQLFSHEIFKDIQKLEHKFSDDLYKMIEQWGSLAFIINKKGAEYILSTLPFDDNIDMIYSNNINKLNSLCFINDVIINKGANNLYDTKSEFGSLLWK